jgi:hypothetical protein
VVHRFAAEHVIETFLREWQVDPVRHGKGDLPDRARISSWRCLW